MNGFRFGHINVQEPLKCHEAYHYLLSLIISHDFIGGDL